MLIIWHKNWPKKNEKMGCMSLLTGHYTFSTTHAIENGNKKNGPPIHDVYSQDIYRLVN